MEWQTGPLQMQLVDEGRESASAAERGALQLISALDCNQAGSEFKIERVLLILETHKRRPKQLMIINILLSGIAAAAAIYLIIAIHEAGHYMAGRWVVGIPFSEIAIVMTEVPQHVALRGKDEWVSPQDFERYGDLYQRYDPELEHLTVYVGAGLVLQTLGVALGAVALASAGQAGIGRWIVRLSLIMTLFYLLYDLVFTWKRGAPAGDVSAIGAVSPWSAVVTLVLFFVPHGALLFGL